MKIDVFCLVRKKTITIDKKLADALVKMKRATYIEKKQEYLTRSLQAEQPKIVKVEIADLDNSDTPKKRGRKKKVD